MNNFEFLRKQNKLSQVDLATKVGVNQGTVSRWESGTCLPDIETIFKICTLYNCSIDYLLSFNIKSQNEQIIEEKLQIPDYQQEVIDLVLKLNSRQCSRLCGYIERQFEETTYKTKDIK